MRIIGVSVEGTSHQETTTPCQDSHDYCIFEQGIVVVSADGAGSADNSQEASRFVVEYAVSRTTALLTEAIPADVEAWEQLLVQITHQTRCSLVEYAIANDYFLDTLHTTFTLVVAAENRLAIAQIGDGFVVAQDETGGFFLAMPPQKGEYAEETFFLTLDEALDILDIRIYSQKMPFFALLTDGLYRLAIKGNNEPFEGFFSPLLRFTNCFADELDAEQELKRFLESERVCSRTDDDKTLILVSTKTE